MTELDPQHTSRTNSSGQANQAGYRKLEDYGVVGNLETCALCSTDGSIDWLCFPLIDSPSVFAAVLDPKKGGLFQISPVDSYDSHQEYQQNSNVLDTVFKAPSGSATLTDFMPAHGRDDPAGNRHRMLLRKLLCTSGELEMSMKFQPCFNYGKDIPHLDLSRSKIVAESGDDRLVLVTTIPLDGTGDPGQRSFTVRKGETCWFLLQYGEEPAIGPGDDAEKLLQETLTFWAKWLEESSISRPIFQGPWHELVIRSALILKLLTNSRTGSVIAAATTSLPESLGGVRNWDYRYSWIRDSSFVVQALEQLGHRAEALEYFHWLKEVAYMDVKKDGPAKIRIAYTFDGKNVPPEQDVPWLRGYMDSAPVRVGNAAFNQDQLDIFGEIICTFYLARGYEKDLVHRYRNLICDIVDHICAHWKDKDSGIWEFRAEKRHFVHSKLMCWVGLDRALKMAPDLGEKGKVSKWERARDEIRNEILTKGFDTEQNSFVQAFGYKALDATSLLIPVLGLLPPNDPRVLGTIEALCGKLMKRGFLHRYQADDGLPGKEGVFIICSFWLVKALALSGQVDRAAKQFEHILESRSPLGLFSEEVDPRTGLQIGNFPQAFSHIGLLNAALYLGKVQRLEEPGPSLMGSE